MNKFAILLLNLILISPVFAGNIIQQDVPIYSDQDLKKYKKASDQNLSPESLEHDKNKAIEINSGERADAQESAVTESRHEISESEKKSIEREFSRIAGSMLSQLKAGNIEGAIDFFVESSKDRHRQIFNVLKDNNTLRLMADGYMGVEIVRIGDHLAQCDMNRKENGTIYSYGIKFVEVAKGVWKIYDF